VKKLLILAMAVTVVLFSFSLAGAYWEWQYPGSSMVIPYFNATAGFQTFVLISHQDTDPDWGQDSTDPNVNVRFNPKCGRGDITSHSLTTKQSWVFIPPASSSIEGWVEAYEKTDISDQSQDDDYPLSGIAVILDIANGIAYSLETVQYYEYICVDSTNNPLFYNCDCTGVCTGPEWGDYEDDPLVARLWRNSANGRTMFVLLDPSGRHIATSTIPVPAAGHWLPSELYVSNRAQLDIYSKAETDSHLTAEWCGGTDAGKPGIVTIGVGSTTGPSGIVTDLLINDPAAGLTDAPYGFGQAYNTRRWFWIDLNSDGLMQPGEEIEDYSNILAGVLTQISPTYFPHATHAQQMASKWTTY